jgi:3-oxoacyl-[acyl-carrier protein] reductase
MRNVVVTGATRGVGLGIAQALVDAGYHAIVIARTPSAAVFDAMIVDPEHWSFVPCDLTKTETLSRLAATLRQDFNSIYGLVNNAGIGTSGILSTMPDSHIAYVLQMNVIAPLTLTKYLVRPMMSAREGRVVNISSIVAKTGYSGLSAYSASKAAIEGFTRSLAREVGSLGITVNAVAPGFIDTKMTHGLTEKRRQQIARRSALQRLTSVADIANAVTFLMGGSAANIAGTVMTVDAGNTA